MQFIEDIKIITLFSLAFFSVFLFSYQKGNQKSNVILACIFGFQALEALNGTFYRFANFWINEFPWVFYTTEFTFFLWGPAIYYFFISATKSEFKFSKKEMWHLAPAVIHTIFLIFKFHIHSNEAKTLMLQSSVMSPLEDIIIHSLRNLATLVYILFATRYMRNKRDQSDKKYSWLLFLLVVFYLVEIIQIMQFFDLETRIYNTIIYNTTSIVWFLVAVTTLFKALKNPFFFSNEEVINAHKDEDKRTESFIMEDEEFQELLSKIKQKVINDSLYLEPELNLQQLADQTNSTSKKVSHVINIHYHQNFSDFINSFRIEKAKELLADKSKEDYNVMEIGYEVGFNSKATFNRVFSKFTNISPTEYRKTQMAN
jgi:AraC-like DNA-binding protein